VQIAFLTVPLSAGQSLVKIVEKQLSHYHYTYPTSGHVSVILFGGLWLIFRQGNPLTALPLRTRPYRNPQIIAVIRQLYFEGGTSSFVHRFDKCVDHFFIMWLCVANMSESL
jgi:hypothetical protein